MVSAMARTIKKDNSKTINHRKNKTLVSLLPRKTLTKGELHRLERKIKSENIKMVVY